RNLITNAFRYGGPNIEVVTAAEQGLIAVEVIDDGGGIPTEDQDRIFIAYERAHHTAGQPGSVGVGLTISRTLAELMGGSLTYRFDGRSVFRLELPRVAEESLDAPQSPRISGDEVALDIGPFRTGRFGVDVAAID
ncbi:MAG: ATP-binding protein, partial [Actinomycetota bacterium]|nr:ATP-binding protein [Actinomycetota bacterium]